MPITVSNIDKDRSSFASIIHHAIQVYNLINLDRQSNCNWSGNPWPVSTL